MGVKANAVVMHAGAVTRLAERIEDLVKLKEQLERSELINRHMDTPCWVRISHAFVAARLELMDDMEKAIEILAREGGDNAN